MDQAASLLGAAGHALLLEFRPLRVRRVAVPAELAIVVADSGIRAEKAGLAQRAYNDRVASCRAAAALLGAPPGGLLAEVPGPDRRQRALALADPVLARRAGFVFAEEHQCGIWVTPLVEPAHLSVFGLSQRALAAMARVMDQQTREIEGKLVRNRRQWLALLLTYAFS